MTEIVSEVIFTNLLADAEHYKRPDVRIATLDRLKRACDAIENGEARNLIEKRLGEKRSSELAITPSNIDKFIRAKQWNGPTRSTIAKKDGNSSLKPYVDAREDERTKTITPKIRRPSQELENALREINSIEVRQYVRRLFEQRKMAEAKYTALKSGIEKMPAISIDEVLGIAKEKANYDLLSQNSAELNSSDRHALGKIFEKLTDNETLGREFNLQSQGSLQHAQTMKRLLTKKEMDLLRRLASPAGALLIEQK